MEFDKKLSNIYINNSDDTIVDVRELIEKYSYYWIWFVISVIITLALAYFYLRYTPNEYRVTTTIFIDDKDSGGLTSELSVFEDLGVFGGSKATIINEIGMLKSRSLLENVIKDLQLNVSYIDKGKVMDVELYKDRAPFNINFFIKDSIFYQLDVTFLITRNSKKQFILSTSDKIIINKIEFGKNIKTYFGEINITPKNLKNIEIGETTIIRIHPLKSIVDNYRARISIEPESIKSSLLILSLTDPVKQKAQDILDHLVVQYNNDAINFKNLITKNTDKFINDRINDISDDLANVDMGVEEFKRKNRLTNIDLEASLVLESNAEIEKTIVDLSSQIKLINYVIAQMQNNKEELIPSNLGLKDQRANESAIIYNKLLLERNRIIKSSSKLNPTVINIDAQLEKLRQSIGQSLMNLRSSLTFSLEEANNQSYQLGTKRILAPKQEREFQDIKRKQQIIETLYLYLLQKREENAISLGIPVPKSKIVDKANGSDHPVAPNHKVIYAIALLVGFLIPLSIISILTFFDNKIHYVEDIESKVSLPILGDIPHTKSKKKIVVTEKDTDSVAESFRLLRTNISFMLSSVEEGGKVIMLTSTIGGEGKTFVAINLASVLASTNKKVLLIGADLRKPKINKYLKIHHGKGLTEYLVDSNLYVSDIIVPAKVSNFNIIRSGERPPNPSDLLMNKRFEKVLEYGKENYDFIIVDTPPVSLVTDTLLISHLADLFIYIVRANYLDKRLLKTPKLMYDQNRLPNMALLLNDTNYKKRSYSYGYGYGNK